LSLRILSVCAAALVAACEERVEEPAETRAPSDEARNARPATERTIPGRAGESQVSGRRGDRHARAAARKSPSVKRVEGKIARASERQVVIRPSGSPEMTLRVAPGTTVTVDGRPARVEALQQGAEVRAAYETGDGMRPTAITIEARSAAAKEVPRRSEPDPHATGGSG